jgi:hypothetical protein
VVSFTWLFYSHRKGPSVSIGQEAEWDPEPVWALWDREKYLAPGRNQTLVIQPTVIPTALSQLYKEQVTFQKNSNSMK